MPSHSYTKSRISRLFAIRGFSMFDVIYVLLGIAGFVACLGLVHLCDRL